VPADLAQNHHPSSSFQEPRKPILPILAVVIALTALLAGVAEDLAFECEDNQVTFMSMSGDWDSYLELRREWRPRILSNGIAGLLAASFLKLVDYADAAFVQTLQAWTAGWFLLICVLAICQSRKMALFYILGTFVGVIYGYFPLFVTRIYPWDMPALFFFTLAIFLIRSSRVSPLYLILPLGMLFKETAIVLCLAFLFLDMPWRQRLRKFSIALALCLAAKIAADLAVGLSVPVFTPTASDRYGLRLDQNWAILLHRHEGSWTNPILVNGGLLIALFLTSWRDRSLLMLKTVAIVFAANIVVFGMINEYRIWFEMIPVALYALEIVYFGDSSGQEFNKSVDAGRHSLQALC
jgi:hypothetical protein